MNRHHTPPSQDPARNRPMANALGDLRQRMRQDLREAEAPAFAKPKPPKKTPPSPTATPLGKSSKRIDPFATIEQPHNEPLPKPLAQALDALGRQIQTQPIAAPPPAPSPSAAPASFAQLMREQGRLPAPNALQEKINWGNQAEQPASQKSSIRLQENNNGRIDGHTPKIFTLPPSNSAPRKTQAAGAHSLQNLKALHKAHQAAQAKQQAEEAKVQAKARAQHAAHQAFLQAVGKVQPLPDAGKVLHHQPRDPVPTQRKLDEQAVLREALSDEFDAGTLLDTDENLSFLRPGVSLDVARKLRKGEWTIQKQVDLHGLRTDEARETLSRFIRECHRAGLRCVRVIHGKGLGSPGNAPVLKSRVNRWLVQKAEVMAFVQANPNQGGQGAVLVLLRSPR